MARFVDGHLEHPLAKLPGLVFGAVEIAVSRQRPDAPTRSERLACPKTKFQPRPGQRSVVVRPNTATGSRGRLGLRGFPKRRSSEFAGHPANCARFTRDHIQADPIEDLGPHMVEPRKQLGRLADELFLCGCEIADRLDVKRRANFRRPIRIRVPILLECLPALRMRGEPITGAGGCFFDGAARCLSAATRSWAREGASAPCIGDFTLAKNANATAMPSDTEMGNQRGQSESSRVVASCLPLTGSGSSFILA